MPPLPRPAPAGLELRAGPVAGEWRSTCLRSGLSLNMLPPPRAASPSASRPAIASAHQSLPYSFQNRTRPDVCCPPRGPRPSKTTTSHACSPRLWRWQASVGTRTFNGMMKMTQLRGQPHRPPRSFPAIASAPASNNPGRVGVSEPPPGRHYRRAATLPQSQTRLLVHPPPTAAAATGR
eukprot:62319-Chlamydomonas_euryale.AAC.7